MKIAYYEAECHVGYACPVIRKRRREDLVAEIAETCRSDWKKTVLGWDGWWVRQKVKSVPPPGHETTPWPPMPETDQEVIDTYFWADPDAPDGGPWISIERLELDISPPTDKTIFLDPGSPAFCATRLAPHTSKEPGTATYSAGGAVVSGTLMSDCGIVSDALEGFILALTAAGFPVDHPDFRETLSGYCESLGNELSNSFDLLDALQEMVFRFDHNESPEDRAVLDAAQEVLEGYQ